MKISVVLPQVAFLMILIGFSGPTQAATTTASTTEATYHNPAAVEKKVREYFADTPAMIEIARCESKFRQYTDGGSPLRGGASGGMVGVFQFYESIHSAGAKALGFDLTTLEGNLGYAKHVYQSQGTTPWNSARYCWEQTVSGTVSATEATPPTRAELTAKIEKLLQIIKILKQLQELRALQN